MQSIITIQIFFFILNGNLIGTCKQGIFRVSILKKGVQIVINYNGDSCLAYSFMDILPLDAVNRQIIGIWALCHLMVFMLHHAAWCCALLAIMGSLLVGLLEFLWWLLYSTSLQMHRVFNMRKICLTFINSPSKLIPHWLSHTTERVSFHIPSFSSPFLNQADRCPIPNRLGKRRYNTAVATLRTTLAPVTWIYQKNSASVGEACIVPTERYISPTIFDSFYNKSL